VLEAEPVSETEAEAVPEAAPAPEPPAERESEPVTPDAAAPDEEDLPPARSRPRTPRPAAKEAKPKPQPPAKPKARVKAKPDAAPRSRRRRAVRDNVIATFGLTKRFGGLVAVDDLDLEVQRGEVFGYLGPNGSGKSTTIRMLLDFIRPSQGTFELLGTEGAEPSLRRRIGYMPAELRFDPRYTTDDAIEFYGALRGGYDATWVKTLTDRFDLDTERPIGQLSTGNKRKVGIVQAFMHRPELYILDEPTQGLDPLLQFEFHQLIGDVKRDGATVFLSSHVLPEVEALADRVGILRRGKLVTVARVDELQRQARQRIDLHVAGSASVKPFDNLPGVVDARRSGSIISLVVEGPVDAVIKEAAKVNVRRIVTRESDLEDVFLEYYKDDT
jgi:ABC-2 type transport system ATP-binding protein